MPERIEPGQPQQNGRHERMHRTLKAATAKPPKGSLSAQQRAFNHFRQWEGREVFVSKTLAGEPVGLKSLDHDRWELYFGRLPLGILDARTHKIVRPGPIKVSTMCPVSDVNDVSDPTRLPNDAGFPLPRERRRILHQFPQLSIERP